MLIKVESWGEYHAPHHTSSAESELGIKEIKGSHWRTFKVINKNLFLMNKLKYGIVATVICKL